MIDKTALFVTNAHILTSTYRFPDFSLAPAAPLCPRTVSTAAVVVTPSWAARRRRTSPGRYRTRWLRIQVLKCCNCDVYGISANLLSFNFEIVFHDVAIHASRIYCMFFFARLYSVILLKIFQGLWCTYKNIQSDRRNYSSEQEL